MAPEVTARRGRGKPDLDEGKLREFRERLLAAKEAAEALLSQSAKESRPVETSGSSIGRLTRIDAIQMQGMTQMSEGQLRIRLQQIEVALDAMEGGTYGSCRYCKGPIGLPRLEAMPEAPFCLECQESFEREKGR